MARGRVPAWVALTPFALAALLFLRGLAMEREAETSTWPGEPAENDWFDPSSLELGPLPGWADPRWAEEFAALLDRCPSFRADDELALEHLRGTLAALSFVAAVATVAEAAEVAEVDGSRGRRAEVELSLELRVPVACVAVGSSFRTVARDGTLLSGLWPAPPWIRTGWLPVIAAGTDDPQVFLGAQAADWLSEPEHLDALDVARSLDDHLPEERRERLGRVRIDAARGRLASPDEPGVQLELEDHRLVVFGRPPSTEEPGELPYARKWAGLSQALALLDGDGTADGEPRDWDLVDLRWDRLEIRYVEPDPIPRR